MDQGVITVLNACYWRRNFAQAIAAAEEDTDAFLEGLCL